MKNLSIMNKLTLSLLTIIYLYHFCRLVYYQYDKMYEIMCITLNIINLFCLLVLNTIKLCRKIISMVVDSGIQNTNITF